MKKIRVFDPALCCSTGVCGVEVDQALVSFSADVAWADTQGAQIERFNLAQQPMAFAQDPAAKGFLERSGHEALPLILFDGEMALVGSLPQSCRAGAMGRNRFAGRSDRHKQLLPR